MSADEAKKQTFSNNATLKLHGYEYQKLFALDCCLKSKPGEIIFIECYGDVATSDTSYELKNRHENFNMTDQSPDFWKTLKNFVKERNNISQFSKLVLHTTASVDGSVFSEWNIKSPKQKLLLIDPVRKNPNRSIKEFTDVIFDFNDAYTENDLLNILSKLEIHHSQISIREICDEIKNSQPFLFIDENLREMMLEWLHGYISMKSIKDSNRWKIIRDVFIKDIQQYVRNIQQHDIPFPSLPLDVEYTGNENYRFINELRAIELESEVQSAVIDYLRAEKNSLKLVLAGGYFVRESIDNFESELENKMKIQKQRDAIEYEPKAIKKAVKLFLNCKLFPTMKIRGVQPIEGYYQFGKMHKIVDEKDFSWRFEEKDLS